MIDTKQLDLEIYKKGYSQKDVAEKIGIHPKTFSRKMKKGVFGSDEIEKIIKVLEIKEPMKIFFV